MGKLFYHIMCAFLLHCFYSKHTTKSSIICSNKKPCFNHLRHGQWLENFKQEQKLHSYTDDILLYLYQLRQYWIRNRFFVETMWVWKYINCINRYDICLYWYICCYWNWNLSWQNESLLVCVKDCISIRIHKPCDCYFLASYRNFVGCFDILFDRWSKSSANYSSSLFSFYWKYSSNTTSFGPWSNDELCPVVLIFLCIYLFSHFKKWRKSQF